MILVTGATGHFGSKAIDHLLEKGIKPSQIIALVRDSEKAEKLADRGIAIRIGDYNNYNSLLDAFAGVDKLLLVSSSDKGDVENRTIQHINAINAAKNASVKHIVYTSFVRKPYFEDSAIAKFQNSHVQTEEALKDSGLLYTILQNGMFLEMIPIFAGQQVADKKMILFSAGQGKTSFVLRDELAQAAAHVVSTDGHENKIYQLTNLESVSFEDIAKAFSIALGSEVEYKSPVINDFKDILTSAGLPEIYIGMFVMWAQAQAEGAMDVEDDTLQKILGKNPTTMTEFIQQVYAKKNNG
ncbi:NAD(P)H-binding protein [Pedobacter petrophilus]|uniref:NAD(P)H-binding protein n=2 Tax=Pedobacter TaxID=84567 RepID=A0A7K0G429_9SPHI|nr:SDR family oxidoreductase [Pedobacter petrophilus]MRX78568.1 NAD(P)H-binding protein [Pedobacter petrophilus]